MIEEWKDIEGYEGKYQISNFGRVKSLKRKTFRYELKEDIFLKPMKSENPYYQVALCKNGKSKRVLIHRIVAKHFLPNNKEKQQVNHKDGNKLNNNILNLEWVTPHENLQHAYDLGLIPHEHMVKMTNISKKITRKFNKEDIQDIFNLHNVGISKAEISRKYNVGETTIRNVIFRNTYKDIGV